MCRVRADLATLGHRMSHDLRKPRYGDRNLRAPEWPDVVERGAEAITFDLQVVATLEIKPEPLGCAEVASQPQCGVGADPALAVHDRVDPAGRYPNVDRQLVLSDPQRCEVLLGEDLAGVDGRHRHRRWHGYLRSVVVDDLDIF